MLKFQGICTDVPEDLRPILSEFPDLQPGMSPVINGNEERENSTSPTQERFSRPKSTSIPISPGQPSQRKRSTSQPQQPKNVSSTQPSSFGSSTSSQPASFERRAAVPWAPRPTFMKDEKDSVVRDINGFLNKITPEKFQKLSQKICGVFGEIATPEIYAEAVSLVFAKAVSEPSFSKMYAELCVKLSATPSKVPEEKLTFRRALLNRCQEEFEKASQKIENLPSDPEEATLVRHKERKKKIGNVKFIGELFKFKLLSEKIIHGCIKILFSAIYKYKDDREPLEMNCELLCKMFSTIGKLIDIPEARTYLTTYFAHIGKLASDPNMSSRIRFLFESIIELRRNNWIPRREEQGPKKLSEIHAEAMQKEWETEFGLIPPTASSSPKFNAPISSHIVEPKVIAQPQKNTLNLRNRKERD